MVKYQSLDITGPSKLSTKRLGGSYWHVFVTVFNMCMHDAIHTIQKQLIHFKQTSSWNRKNVTSLSIIHAN
jgi:hypothetical protein